MSSPNLFSKNNRLPLGNSNSRPFREGDGVNVDLSPKNDYLQSNLSPNSRSTTLPSNSSKSSGGPSPHLTHSNSLPVSTPTFQSSTISPQIDRKYSHNSTVIDLNYKKLQELPASLENYKNSLEKLSLAYNLLQALPKFLINFNNLTNVNLRSNAFSDFPRALCHLSSLSILDISRNRIRYFPKEPGTLLYLKMLNVSKNHLLSLPSYFGHMQHLEIFKFEENPFVSGHEFLSREHTLDKKEWLEKLLGILKELEASGIDGISHQPSRGSTRTTLPFSPARKGRRRSSIKHTSISAYRRSSTTKENSNKNIPRSTSHREFSKESLASSDEDSHSAKGGESSHLGDDNTEPIFLSESPKLARKRSIIRRHSRSKVENMNAKSGSSSSLESDQLDLLRLCAKHCLQQNEEKKSGSFRAFNQILYVAYFVLDRFQPWLNPLDQDFRFFSQLSESTQEMLQILSSESIDDQLALDLGKKLTTRVLSFIKLIQSKTTIWAQAISFSALRSIAFILQEATWQLHEACSSISKTYDLPFITRVSGNDLNISPSFSEKIIPHDFSISPDQQPKSPLLSRRKSNSSISSLLEADIYPQERKLGSNIPVTLNPAHLNEKAKVKYDSLHLTAHMATSSAFKIIQLLGDHLEDGSYRKNVPWTSHLQMADDSTHLLVSSLNLVTATTTSTSTLNSAPLPLFQRYLQDIFSFVKDIIQLTKALQAFHGPDSEAGPIPQPLIPHLQTLTHTTKQLTGLLKIYGSNPPSQGNNTPGQASSQVTSISSL